MLKADALILLVNSLSKSEKKSFRMNRKDSDYMFLFDTIEAKKNISSKDLRDRFLQEKQKKSFDVAVNYLYRALLDTLLSLRKEQDSHYKLFNKILKARVLFEKSLFEEAFSFLESVKEEALRMENYHALLYASRLELDYLLFVNFPDITEVNLLNKHFKVNEILKIIRKINEQSSLYELLKHRIIYKGGIRSLKQKESFNDLVFSEMSISASSNVENFEISKLHQLFQSSYLIWIGDYKSALQSYYELNNLFEDNKHLRANPPFYYLSVIEGILDNLRNIKNYGEMHYFIEQLSALQYPSVSFQANVNCLIFLYRLFPLLDSGKFSMSKRLIDEHSSTILEKTELLSLPRQAELALYIALTHIGQHNYKAAQKALLKVIIRSKNFYAYPLYRTIRLVNLIIQYETGNLDIIRFETRSIKREISKAEKAYRVEHLMLSFLNKQKSGMFFGEREKIWVKIEPRLIDLRNDIFEMQILKLFDFTAWIESKLCKIPLHEVLQQRCSDRSPKENT